MKRWISFLATVLLLVAVLAGCGANSAGIKLDDSSLVSAAQKLSEKMCQFAESELVKQYAGEALISQISEVRGVLSGNIEKAYIASGGSETGLKILSEYGTGTSLPDSEKKLFAERFHWSETLISQVNAQAGTTDLAVASLLRTSESYYCPGAEGTEYLVFLLTKEGDYSSAAAIYKTGSDVITASVYPIRTEDFSAFEKMASQLGVDLREVPAS